jgi:hypothetical protein
MVSRNGKTKNGKQNFPSLARPPVSCQTHCIFNKLKETRADNKFRLPPLSLRLTPPSFFLSLARTQCLNQSFWLAGIFSFSFFFGFVSRKKKFFDSFYFQNRFIVTNGRFLLYVRCCWWFISENFLIKKLKLLMMMGEK